MEVGKVLHSGIFTEECLGRTPAFNYRRTGRDLTKAPAEVELIAREVRHRFSEMNAKWALYPQTEELNLEDFDLAFVCVELGGILLSDRDRDVFGDALELFRGQWAKRAGGQYFTDQHVTRLAMNLLAFDPRRGDDASTFAPEPADSSSLASTVFENFLKSTQTTARLRPRSLRSQRKRCEVEKSITRSRRSQTHRLVPDLVMSAREIVITGDSLRREAVQVRRSLDRSRQTSLRCVQSTIWYENHDQGSRDPPSVRSRTA